MRRPLVLTARILALAACSVTIDWVTVGDRGDTADTGIRGEGTSGCGSAGYAYWLSKHEVPNAQYAEFLDRLVPTLVSHFGLYDSPATSSSFSGIDCVPGITAGPKDVLKSGMAGKPANFVSFYESLRFADWLNNVQGSASTEMGP